MESQIKEKEIDIQTKVRDEEKSHNDIDRSNSMSRLLSIIQDRSSNYESVLDSEVSKYITNNFEGSYKSSLKFAMFDLPTNPPPNGKSVL